MYTGRTDFCNTGCDCDMSLSLRQAPGVMGGRSRSTHRTSLYHKGCDCDVVRIYLSDYPLLVGCNQRTLRVTFHRTAVPHSFCHTGCDCDISPPSERRVQPNGVTATSLQIMKTPQGGRCSWLLFFFRFFQSVNW